MCQLNIYCVKKEVDKQKVIKFLDGFYGENSSSIIEDIDLNDLSKEYNFYVDSKFMCDCGSVVSRFEGVNSSFEEFKRVENEKEYERLIKLKEIMGRENYAEDREKFFNLSKEILDKINDTYLPINEIENKMIQEIESRNDLSDKGKLDMIKNSVPKMIKKLISNNGLEKERQRLYKQYNDLCEQNKDIYDTSMYVTDVALAEKYINGDRFVCNYIDYCLEELKNYLFDYLEKEYEKLVNVIKNILTITDEIKLFSCWQDNEDMKFINEREIHIGDLKIDDIVFLKYKELITIKR